MYLSANASRGDRYEWISSFASSKVGIKKRCVLQTLYAG